MFIVSIGAVIGMLITMGIVTVGRFLPKTAIEAVGVPVLSLGVLGVTMALLAGVAFMAAYFPAQRAASLDPVECMR